MSRRRGHFRSNSTPDGKKPNKFGPSPTKTGGVVPTTHLSSQPEASPIPRYPPSSSTSTTTTTTTTYSPPPHPPQFKSSLTPSSQDPSSSSSSTVSKNGTSFPSTPTRSVHSSSSYSFHPPSTPSSSSTLIMSSPRHLNSSELSRHRRSTSFSSVSPHTPSTTSPTFSPSDPSSSSPSQVSSSSTEPTAPIFYPASAAPAQDWYDGGHLFVDSTVIRDAYGRTVQLRGVNLCGNSKLPSTPHADNPERPEFFDTCHCSFVHRPFPLEDAHEHFSRLSHWGLTFIRLLVPWEALEHAGPGMYDEEYIDYLIKLCSLMSEYGVKCFIDPHQDVWSRFSGGSGAPGWTLEVAGFDIRKFKATGAAHVHNVHVAGQCDCAVDPVTGVYLPKQETASNQRSLSGQPPPMLWPTNYTKLASSTMFTLFFAGETLAPNRMVEGQNIQTYLQTHYINAYKYLASRLKHLEAVIGFEVINEPHQGYIGLRDLTKYDPVETLMLGDSPSALQSFCLGQGLPQLVEVWVKSWPVPSRKQSSRVLNAEQERVWLPGYDCPWKEAGVYEISSTTNTPHLLNPDYFTVHPKTKERLDFNQHFYLPFVMKYATAIQQVFPKSMIFVEPIPLEPPPIFYQHIKQLIFAPHWYDLNSVFNKTFNGYITHDVSALRMSKNVLKATYFGLHGAKKNYSNQLFRIKRTGVDRVGLVPMVVGECGIPMDLNRRVAFDTGDYVHHNNFLDAVISAMESNLVHFTLWNYNPGNDHAHGDQWNGEDFSIFSPHPFRQYSLKSEQKRQHKKRNAIERWTKELTRTFLSNGKNNNTSMNPSININTNTNTTTSRGSSSDSNTSLTSPTSTSVSPLTPFDLTDFFFSEDVKHHTGGRVLDAVIRPYAARIAGTPTHMSFDLKTLKFRLEFKSHQHKLLSGDAAFESKYRVLTGELPLQSYETVIFVPKYHYGYESLHVQVSDGVWSYYKHEQTLFWRILPSGPDSIHWLEMNVKVHPSSGTATTAGLLWLEFRNLKRQTQTWISLGVVVVAVIVMYFSWYSKHS